MLITPLFGAVLWVGHVEWVGSYVGQEITGVMWGGKRTYLLIRITVWVRAVEGVKSPHGCRGNVYYICKLAIASVSRLLISHRGSKVML